MTTQSQLEGKRLEILEKMGCIATMRKGSLNSKYNENVNKQGQVSKAGPYYVLTGKGPGNKTVSKSIPAKDAPRVQQEVDNYKQFRQLSDEYIEICERLALLEEAGEGAKKN